MALPTWPAVNYRPQKSGFQITKRFLDPIATDMEGGNTRERPRPGDNVGTVVQTINLTLAEHDVFVAWVRDTIGNGSGRFTASIWLGSSYVSKTCKFAKGGKPSYVPVGTRYVAVSMTLMVFNL
ncbi:hypothetical protein HAP47_0022625 [Bradyrhizobium sp. 41S5]|uniref:hypothetical protein n=1 Tax=Bradyrhizobium sp. 41S5 TaxID=1404443 RepID=UPI00156A741A|nr:hypothetical protein [Bradyrhizobium sp. 41S5]UFX42060.1 hypothetical protein HAP47_0022625 [Bradyrhizobium sp. 41S5]